MTDVQVVVTPDGARYLTAAAGHPVPAPFNLRWLLPRLCGQRLSWWRAATYMGVAFTMVGIVWLAGTWQAGVAAAVLFVGLPSVRFNLRHPVLVDIPALGLATMSAALLHHGYLLPAVAVAVVAGMTKESSPVFAAVFAWNPLPLVALAAPLVRKLLDTPGPDVLDATNKWILEHPVKAAKAWHWPQVATLDPILVIPWGGCLVAAAHMTWPVAIALAAGYAQLCVATDTVRLYQWAAPVVCIAAIHAVPMAWWPVLVVVTVFNPARGDGL